MFQTGKWIKRVTPHLSSDEMGHLTQGRSYQVMSAKIHYSGSRNFLNKAGNPIGDANTKLADDCVVLRDDRGRYGIFGARNFMLTSKT